MTVKELIKKLEMCDQDKEISIMTDNDWEDITDVESIEVFSKGNKRKTTSVYIIKGEW